MADSRPQQATDPLTLLGKQLLERYAIRECLAHGGMSVVYAGYDERLQRPVCVKVFFGLDRSMEAYQATYEHFVQEAFALSQLQHPNTLRIYDFGYLPEEPRSPFYVSELMDGGTLRNHVRRHGRLPPRAAYGILEPLVGALSEAHARGIVHRDIKPTNILFGRAGSRQIVKLADFGIAKAQLGETGSPIPNRASETQEIPGKRIALFSPGWAAPEQLRGHPVGATADVFSLGLVAIYMMSGKKLYSDRNLPRMMEDRAEGDGYVERALVQFEIAPAVAQVVRRGCRSDPRDRFQSVDHFLSALRATLKSEAGSTGERLDPLDSTDLVRDEIQTVPNRVRGSGVASVSASPVSAGALAAVASATPASAVGRVASPTPVDQVIIASLTGDEIVAGGRRIRLLPAAESHLDVETQILVAGVPLRLRLTLLPDPLAPARLHVKGLNCFVRKPGGRPSGAADIDDDLELELLSSDRKQAQPIRCAFGQSGAQGRLFAAGTATIAIPAAVTSRAVLLDFGPGRDSFLVYRAVSTARKRGAR
jgi:serine/threonine-protein kinase